MYVKDTTLYCETKVEYDFVMLLAVLRLLRFPAGVTGFAGVGDWTTHNRRQWGGW